MKSPFAIFRKHQKMAMVILLLLVMIAFTVGGTLMRMSSGGMSGSMVTLLLACIGAAVLAVVGMQKGKASSYAMAGAIIGAVIGLAGSRISSPTEAVQISIGDLSRRELIELVQNRQLANRIVQTVFMETTEPNSFSTPPSFGFRNMRSREDLERDVVLGHLLRHEADQIGISVSDTAVNTFFKQLTGNKIRRESLRKVRTDLGLSETALYDAIRNELKSQIAMQMATPRTLSTPEEYWQIYRRLHVTQELEVSALPVDSFTAEVPAPTDEEISVFFEDHKSVFPNQIGPGEPGFRQPQKVRFAYLEIDRQTVEDEVLLENPVTDEEIQKHYEDQKETYRNHPMPEFEKPSDEKDDESEPVLPEFAPEKGEESDQQKPDVKSLEPNRESEDRVENSGPVRAPKPKRDESVRKESDDQKPDDQEQAKEQPPKEHKPLPEFKPLDDALKETIRSHLRDERTSAAMKEKSKAAYDYMYRLSDKYHMLDDDPKKLTGEQVEKQLKEYARKKNLAYKATKLLSGQELSDEIAYPISAATDPDQNPFGRNVRTVIDQLFGTSVELIYTASIAEELLTKEKRYVYWKLEHVDVHVPNLGDPGIKQQVFQAWKEQQARPLAKKRADELATIVRQSDKNMEEALAGRMLGETKDGVLVSVRPSESFSWLRRSSAPSPNPLQMSVPELSTISAVEKAGPSFMQVVFEQLKNGEVGVAPNADKSIYYVVKVQNRTPSTEAGKEALQQAFLKTDLFFYFSRNLMSPYRKLIEQQQQVSNYNWTVAIEEKYKVWWNESQRQ